MRELRGRRDERGAIGVLIGVLMAMGVLLGMGALVVDVGQLYQNRAELQGGADAAALGVARSCALTGSCDTGVSLNYAKANASNLTGYDAAVGQVCGVGPNLVLCTGSGTGALSDCAAAPAAGIKYVDVPTSTRLPGGSTLLPPAFAATLLGNQAYTGSTVRACAQAEWGPPAAATALAFTISACTWDNATNQGGGPGTSFAPLPPSTADAPFDQVLHVHDPGSTNPQGCPTEPSGADNPGNFGWTDTSGNCLTTLTFTGAGQTTYGGSTGVSAKPPSGCVTALQNDYQNHAVILIPVYTTVTAPGSNATYLLKGFAAFVVTGYNVPGASAPDWVDPSHNGPNPNKNQCNGDHGTFCIDGFFTRALVPSSGPVGSGNGQPDLGADIVVLSG